MRSQDFRPNSCSAQSPTGSITTCRRTNYRRASRVTEAMASPRYLDVTGGSAAMAFQPADHSRIHGLKGLDRTGPPRRKKSGPAAGRRESSPATTRCYTGVGRQPNGRATPPSLATARQEREENSEALQEISTRTGRSPGRRRLRRRHCYGWGWWRERRMARTVSPSGCCAHRSSKPQQTRGRKVTELLG